MTIQSVNAGNLGGPAAKTKLANKSATETNNQTVGSVPKSDTVSITNNIKNASDTDASAPVVDRNRVDAIKEALRTGSYQIKPEIIAEKMMDLEQQLFSNST
ncbi:flagellar biosynthesis anti-sigma factor FlgM [Methylomonas sp. MgM2]